MLDKLYTQSDFSNLTKEDIKKIQYELDLKIPNEVSSYEYLYENLHKIEDNKKVNEFISKKLLAGQVSVKWFRFNYDDEVTEEFLKNKLESLELGYNVKIEDRVKLNIEDDIISIINEKDIYTMKLFVLDGYKSIATGYKLKREKEIKSIVVKINLKKCWIEIRGNEKICRKVELILKKRLKLKELKEIRILNKYSNDINKFKEDLIDGFYMKSKAVPNKSIELTEDDAKSIAGIIKSIDEYFDDKDEKKFLSTLKEINFEPEDLTFTSILLAGIDNFGIKIRNDSERDISKQSLYNILKDDFEEDSSYIKFSVVKGGEAYTMQVGVKSNSIVFKTSVTEDVISYIREKVCG